MSNKERKNLGSFRELHLAKALRLVWQSTPKWTIAGIALIILQGALPLLTLYLMKLIVDAVNSRHRLS